MGTRMTYAQITDIPFAVELYYSRIELSNADISKLLGLKSSSSILRFKKRAHEKAKELGIPEWGRRTVNTEAAYLAWGLDIKQLEQRMKKLEALRRARE